MKLGPKAVFIRNNPQWLSGVSKPTSVHGSRYVEIDERFVKDAIKFRITNVDDTDKSSTVQKFLLKHGQVIYSGINLYSSAFRFNTSIEDPKDMTMGVEIETVAKSNAIHSGIKLGKYLKSNWFYMRYDGSLPNNGVEVITIPLASSFYRKQELWEGLSYLLSRFTTSKNCGSSGFHVHVGTKGLCINNEKFNRNEDSVRSTIMFLYFYLCKQNPLFFDELFGRVCTSYCLPLKLHNSAATKIDDLKTLSKLLPRKYFKAIVNSPLLSNKFEDPIRSGSFPPFDNTGHVSEVNVSTRSTIEFRHGKGQLDPQRIFAIIEFIHALCSYVRDNNVSLLDIENHLSRLKSRLVKTKSRLLTNLALKRFFGSCDTYAPKPWPWREYLNVGGIG